MLFAAMTVCGVRLPSKNYTTGEGLPHDRVNRIVRDSRGFLWFCTSEGLARFDGSVFKNYRQDEGLPHRSIFDVLETRDGRLWIATGDGVVLFNPLGESTKSGIQNPESKIQMFRVFRDGQTKLPLTVYDLIEDRTGRIWAATSAGLYRIKSSGEDWRLERFDTQAWQPDTKSFTALLEDRRGAVWVGAERGLYRILPDDTIQTLEIGLRITAGAMLEDRTGRIWVGTGGESRGLYQFVLPDAENAPRRARIFDSRDGLASDTWMNALFETSDGRIFVGVDKALCEFSPDASGKSFQAVFVENMLSLGEDASGNLWLGTTSAGAFRLTRGGFLTFDETDGLKIKNAASIVSGADGETYVIAGDGVIHRFDEKKFTAVAPLQMTLMNWSANQVAFQDRTGEWWVPGYAGLQRYPATARLEDLSRTAPKKLYTKADGLYANGVFQLFEDSRGDIWIGILDNNLKDAVQRWERATDTIRSYTSADGFPTESCPTAFGEDRAGNVWMGFYAGGLGRVRGGKIEMFTAQDGLPGGFIRDIHTDRRGRIWVATVSGGAVRIDNPTDEKPVLTNLTTADGLASNQANCIAEDDFGHIYVGTGRGVNQIDLQTGRIKLFTKADGLPENLVTLCQADATGAVWFGTFRGLARYVPTNEEKSASPPIFVGAIRVNGETVQKVSELGEKVVENLDFATDQRQVQIEFFALGFAAGEGLRFQYKFGADDWSEPSPQRAVNLNLVPGTYDFSVRAVNSGGVTSENPARVSFTIARPVWQQWWFLTLSAFAIIGLIYLIYTYRLRRLLEIERVRTRIATDLHDDIGASLSKIAILTDVINQRITPDSAPIKQPLEEIAETSRELVDSMSDIVWAISPRRDHLSDLLQRMRNLAGEMTDLADIRLLVHLSNIETVSEMPLDTDLRREVYLIFKETINNLVKHSGCQTVEIEFNRENDFLVVAVRDDGKGFDPAATGSNGTRGGNGLPNMRRRAANLGGSCEINSEFGKGTTVRLRVPLKSGFRLKFFLEKLKTAT